MRIASDGERHLVRFDVGERIPDALVELSRSRNWKSGLLTGIGGVSDVVLAYYDLAQREYLRFTVAGIVELVSLSGNLSVLDGEPFWHLHAAVADRFGEVKAGHLMSMKVAITLECVILPIATVVRRSRDEFSGLNLLDI